MEPAKPQFARAKVDLCMYLPESVLLLFSFAMPLLAFLIWRTPDSLVRSGSLMLIFAAIAEFITLNRMNTKHLRNAGRVFAGEQPLDFSLPANVVGYISLLAALAGTFLWGFGDQFF